MRGTPNPLWYSFPIEKTLKWSEVAQSCLTLCDPMDCSLPHSSVHGIFQARVLEWGAIAFSNTWKWKGKVKLLSHVWLFATPWTVAHQAPPSMGFTRQEYWSGLPFPSPEDLPKPGIKPGAPILQADSLLSELQGSPFIYFLSLNTNFCIYNCYSFA